MKKVTSYKLQVTRIAFCFLLSAFCITANAQTDENRILDSATIQKNELKMTPEIEEAVVTKLKSMPEDFYSYRGININKEQLENLDLGKPIPWYNIVFANERLEPVSPYSMSRIAAGEPTLLRFKGWWNVPVLSDGEPFYMSTVKLEDNGQYSYVRGRDSGMLQAIQNYEHKDLLIGLIGMEGKNYLIIRKDNKDIFVEVYNKATGELFKTEYGSGELITLLIYL
jgi:hypothetical protein